MKYGCGIITGRAKAILLPYPAQGHVTPMLRLASMLVQHAGGVQPVIIVPDFIHRRISPQFDDPRLDGIVCLSIKSGTSNSNNDGDQDQGQKVAPNHGHFTAVEEAMEKNMPFHLEKLVLELIGNEEEKEEGVACMVMVVDLLASYAIGVGNRLGIQVAGFWPASFAAFRLIASIPHMLKEGIISDQGSPLDDDATGHPISLGHNGHEPIISLKGKELPWLIGSASARTSRFKFWKRTMKRSRNLPWLLVNSFPEECFISTRNDDDPHMINIVPIQPSAMDTKPITINMKASFWEEDFTSLDWLNQQEVSSVMYISFGSWVNPLLLGEEEKFIKSLALALEATGMPFLWVLGAQWVDSLPEGFFKKKKLLQVAKIVSWAPQMEVLQHKSVGCYLTHCGWNSTIEAIYCKKPLLCYPIAGDQFLNCNYIVNKWKIGMKINGFGQIELENALKRFKEECEMLKERITKLNESFLGKVACHKVQYDHLASFVDQVLNPHHVF